MEFYEKLIEDINKREENEKIIIQKQIQNIIMQKQKLSPENVARLNKEIEESIISDESKCKEDTRSLKKRLEFYGLNPNKLNNL